VSDISDFSDFVPAFVSPGDEMARRKRSTGKPRRSKLIFTDVEQIHGKRVLPFPRSERRVQQQLKIARRAIRAWSVIEAHSDSLPAGVQRAARELLDLLEESQL
jgi:hypothetical protein